MVIKQDTSKILSGINQNGLVLSEKTRFTKEHIVAAELVSSDLAQPIFYGCNFDKCRFEKTDFSNSRFFNKTTLRNCEFISVDFRSSGLNDSQFENCIFTKCDFRQTSFVDCHFKSCKFAQCKIVDTSFSVRNINDVTFAGKLQEVNFVSGGEPTLLHADFKKCKLDYVSFQNCDLKVIIPPEDAQHLYFKDVSSRAKRALERIAARPEAPLDHVLKRRLLKLTSQRGAIFNISNLENYEGVECATALISLLEGSE